MREKKFVLDRMISKGMKLEYPYFWYLENMSLENLQEMLKLLLTK